MKLQESAKKGKLLGRQALKKLLNGRIVFKIHNHQGRSSYRLNMKLKARAILDSYKFSNNGVPTGIDMLENLRIPLDLIMMMAA